MNTNSDLSWIERRLSSPEMQEALVALQGGEDALKTTYMCKEGARRGWLRLLVAGLLYTLHLAFRLWWHGRVGFSHTKGEHEKEGSAVQAPPGPEPTPNLTGRLGDSSRSRVLPPRRQIYPPPLPSIRQPSPSPTPDTVPPALQAVPRTEIVLPTKRKTGHLSLLPPPEEEKPQLNENTHRA